MKTVLRELAPALEQYDLHIIEAQEIPDGFNQHFKLTTREGDKHLIIYRPQPGKPPRDLQFGMRAHPLSKGFSLLPRPVLTITGRPYANTIVGTVALVDWVNGAIGSSPTGWPSRLVCRAASVLAALHRSVRDFRPEREPPEILGSLYLPADDWLARAPDILTEFQEWSEEPDTVVARVDERLAEGRAMFDPVAYHQALEDGTVVVHGDFRPANLVLDGDEIVAVLDLDAAFWDCRVYDLAYACFQFAGDERIHPQERQAPSIAFARCYAKHWPLSVAERRLFPFFLRHVVLKRLLSGWDVGPRLALLDQLDDGLEEELVRAVS